jgi:hypothetical protein
MKYFNISSSFLCLQQNYVAAQKTIRYGLTCSWAEGKLL